METKKSLKNLKKVVADKPTLIVRKKDGEYKIEMRPVGEDSNEDFTPVIYKIANKDYKNYVIERKRKKYLAGQVVEDIWNPNYPEVCDEMYMNVYKHLNRAISLDHNDPNCVFNEKKDKTIDYCSCSDVDMTSDSSSEDVDWEIYFSPPIAYKQ